MIIDILSEFYKKPSDFTADNSTSFVSYDELLPLLAGKKLELADIGPLYDPIFLPELSPEECSITFLSDGKAFSISELPEGTTAEVILSFGDIKNYRSGFLVKKASCRIFPVCRLSSLVHTDDKTYEPKDLRAKFQEAASLTHADGGSFVTDYLDSQKRFVFYLEIENPNDVLLGALEEKLSDGFGTKCTVYILVNGSFSSHRTWRLSSGIPKTLYTRPDVITCISDRSFFRGHMDERF